MVVEVEVEVEVELLVTTDDTSDLNLATVPSISASLTARDRTSASQPSRRANVRATKRGSSPARTESTNRARPAAHAVSESS